MLMPRTAWAHSTTGLEALGFRKRHGGAFTAGGVTLTARHGWATLSASAARSDIDPIDAMLGRPGLWSPRATAAVPRRSSSTCRCSR